MMPLIVERITSPKRPTRIARGFGLAGIGLYLLTGVLYAGSGLVVPYPWAIAMWVLWLAGGVVLVRTYRSQPPWTLAVAIASVALWVVIVQLGSWLFGWTA